MKKSLVPVFLFCLILFNGNTFACDQIVNWENDDREFFDGYDGTSRGMSNNPTTRHIDDFTGVRSSLPVTRYTSPVIYHSDDWVGSVSIYSYDSDANAGADFSNENIIYRGDFSSPVSMTKYTWISKTGDELIYGQRRSLGGDTQTLIIAAGVVLYRNCIINYSVRPPTGQYTDQSTAYSKSQILISQTKTLIDSKCGNAVTPSETSTLKLHINNHPLKNLKVIIDEKIFTTDDTGEVEIPDDGEASLQFTYYDSIEYFSTVVSG
jgi:hypothetical protein